MKVTLPDLAVPRLGLAAFHNRLILRATFILLMLATLALAVVMLHEEKQRSYQNYQSSFAKTQAEIVAKLRHPAGQLALLNPGMTAMMTPLHPLLLPFGSLDFDDQYKARQAVDMAGCNVLYAHNQSLCVAIGNNPYAGGFIYLVGNFASAKLVERARGAVQLADVHRVHVTLTMRGKTWSWVAPYEQNRLTGFVGDSDMLPRGIKPVRDFRGWLWQDAACEDCVRPAYFSIRLPVEPLRDALFQQGRPVWPPMDLEHIRVRLQVFAPNTPLPIFDSNASDAVPPFALRDLQQTLQAGEVLTIHKMGKPAREVARLKGEQAQELPSPWLTRLIRMLPIADFPNSMQSRTVLGDYEVLLSGQLSNLDRSLSVTATRMAWFVAAMLVAIVLAWLIIELSFIRRVARLTKRAATVSHNMPDVAQSLQQLDFNDLRGEDEIGILAGSLSDLLQRVKNDVQREQIRAQQEKDMWHAVGHEIMSPLQSLMVLHGEPGDASHRYVQRMQQAVRVLYGSASPSEALEAATLQVGTLEINAFLRNVADNAHFVGIEQVQYLSDTPAVVYADEFSLEDVITHILRNADRHRITGTPITLSLQLLDNQVLVDIYNSGPQITPALLDKIFEYGVSDHAAQHSERRGQGLFVARTYMAKMGGTIHAENRPDGVSFVIALLRANPAFRS